MSKRVSQLTELLSPSASDIVLIVETATGITKKMTYQNLVNIPNLGWTAAGETWVYASATTFTVAGVDVRTKYPVGTKIRLKQGGSFKYYYIVTTAFSTNTTVTVTGGIDYTLANASITENYFSYSQTTVGHPEYFNFTPSWTNFAVGTGGLALNEGRFKMDGRKVSGYTRAILGSSGASVGASPNYLTPVPLATQYNGSYNYPLGQTWTTDAGTQQYIATLVSTTGNKLAPLVEIVNNVNGYAIPAGPSSGTPMSWGPGDSVQTVFDFEASL